MTLHLKAETEDAGTRLDAFVASRANGLTRSQAARYIEEGRVSVDGKPASKSCRIGGGETVTVDVPEVRETALEPQDIPLDVVYEDEDVIVVNKPSGLVVHPAPGHPDGTLVNALLHHCGPSPGRSGPASYTASIGIPAGSSLPPRTMRPIWGSAPSSATTRWRGRTSVWWWAT